MDARDGGRVERDAQSCTYTPSDKTRSTTTATEGTLCTQNHDQPPPPPQEGGTRLVELVEVRADQGELDVRVEGLDDGVVRGGDKVEGAWWVVGVVVFWM